MIHQHASFETARPTPTGGLMALAGHAQSFARGQEICAQDEPARTVYQVVRGAVRMTRLDRDGRRQISAFHQAGDIFGLEQGDTYNFAAEALSECEVLAARLDTLAAVAGQAAFDRFIAAAALAEMRRSHDHLILLGRRGACEKVAAFLLEAADRSASPMVDLPMGRQDMADFLGLTIETVSRMVTQLTAAGAVTFVCCRRFAVRDRALLERYCE